MQAKRHAASLFGSLAIAAAAMLTPQQAEAGGERWQELAWVYVSPGLLAVPLAQRDFLQLDATWQWSLGGGKMLMPIDKLWILPGGSFEHMVLNPATAIARGSQYRIQPEVRIGSGKERLFIYGLAGLGLDLTSARVEDGITGEVVRRVHAGFNLQVGAGALFHVWDALSVGGELDADLSWNRYSKCSDLCGFAVHTLGIKAVVGYQF